MIMEHFLVRGMLTTFTYLVLSVCCLLLIKDPLQSILLGSLFATCLLPWLFWGIEPNLFAPIYYSSFFLLIVYPLRTLFVFLFPDLVSSIFPPPYDEELVNKALFYSLVGVGAYIAFYYSLPTAVVLRQTRSPLGRQSNTRDWPLKIIAIYLIGWAARVYQIKTNNFYTWLPGEGFDISSFTLLTYIGELCEIAYIFAWIYCLNQKSRNGHWITLLLMCGCEAAYAVTILGRKTYFVHLILFPLMASYLIRGRLRVSVVIPAAFVVIFLIFPYVQSYREFYETKFGQTTEISLVDGASIVIDAATTMYGRETHYSAGLASDSSIWLFGSVVFLNRFHGFDSLMVMLENVPKPFDFVYGRDLLTAPLALIPRAIWKDKPLSQVQSTFDKEMVDKPGADWDYTGANSPYPIAEGYFNAGLIGVILVMLSIAFLQRLLYCGFFLNRRENPFSIGVYIWLFIWVVELGTWVLPAYTYLAQRLVVLGAVWLLFNGSLLWRKQLFPSEISHERSRA